MATTPVTPAPKPTGSLATVINDALENEKKRFHELHDDTSVQAHEIRGAINAYNYLLFHSGNLDTLASSITARKAKEVEAAKTKLEHEKLGASNLRTSTPKPAAPVNPVSEAVESAENLH